MTRKRHDVFTISHCKIHACLQQSPQVEEVTWEFHNVWKKVNLTSLEKRYFRGFRQSRLLFVLNFILV